ncbi:MAG: DUF4160 domain-containing protein [Methylomarinum sp.]|nr:DUF4160 domain-containing protein [Methylomarinum sp.]
MRTISMFYGIVISIFYGEKALHNKPHIHARYQNFKVSICIDTGDILAGELPVKKLRLVIAWIEIHREELLADWDIAQSGEEPFRIEPLR